MFTPFTPLFSVDRKFEHFIVTFFPKSFLASGPGLVSLQAEQKPEQNLRTTLLMTGTWQDSQTNNNNPARESTVHSPQSGAMRERIILS